MNKNVFIAHGRSVKERDELAEIVREFGCNPIIMQLEEKGGGALIEEFETLAKKCVFALILLTPDDPQATSLKDEEIFHARQNVIFEMGWFYRSLGKSCTRLIYKKEVELPSDVTGIVYIKFSESVYEKRDSIRRSLVEGGLVEPT